MIVSVGLDTLNCIVLIKMLRVNDHSVNVLVDGHLLLTREEPTHSLFFNLSEPWMISYVFDAVTSIRICIEDLCH
jgi:hypothetical protein